MKTCCDIHLHQQVILSNSYYFSSKFALKSFKFEGDKTGTLHVGPDQTVIVNHPDNMEFLVNVYVYTGGTLVLPPEFICYDINLHIWYVKESFGF